ncbi:MAG: flippase-like domain-containing protein [Planctomycetes bacterium]|nr:flippase-like domain-containing protein [Planctomycetota bacterium]
MSSPTNTTGRRLWRVLRFGVCAVGLWWVLSRLNWNRIGEAWSACDRTWVALSFLIFFPTIILQAARLVLMLRAQGISVGFWKSLKLSCTGNFFSHFVPAGLVGGDLVKAYYVAQHTPQKTEAVAAVVLDRLFGLFGFVTFAAVGAAIKLNETAVGVVPYLVALLLAVVAVIAVAWSARLRALLGIDKIVAWIRLRGRLRRLVVAASRLREHVGISIASFAATLLAQSIILAAFSVAAIGLGMRADWVGYYAFLSLSLLIAAVPISPGGLGTMEAAMMYFLVGGGLGNGEQVLLLALTMRLIQFVGALPGGFFLMAGMCRPDAAELEQLRGDTMMRG